MKTFTCNGCPLQEVCGVRLAESYSPAALAICDQTHTDAYTTLTEAVVGYPIPLENVRRRPMRTTIEALGKAALTMDVEVEYPGSVVVESMRTDDMLGKMSRYAGDVAVEQSLALAGQAS